MRILYLQQDPSIEVDGAHGAGRRMRALLAAWAAAGHKVEFVSRRLDVSAWQLPEIAVRVVKASAALLRDSASPRQEQLADRVFQQALLRIAERFEPEVFVERASLFGGAAARVAGKLGKAHCLELIAPLQNERLLRAKIDRKTSWDRAEKRVLKSAGAVLCPADNVADYARGLGGRNVEVVRGGVDCSLFDPKPFARGRREQFVAGVYSPPGPWQGIDKVARLVEAMRDRGTDLRVETLGDGAAARALRTMLAKREITEAAKFHGKVEVDQVPKVLARWDLVLLPDAHAAQRPPSLAVYEAMAMGLPVLAPSTEDYRQILADDEASRCVDFDDLEVLCEQVDGLMAGAGDADERRLRAQRYGWQATADALVSSARVPK